MAVLKTSDSNFVRVSSSSSFSFCLINYSSSSDQKLLFIFFTRSLWLIFALLPKKSFSTFVEKTRARELKTYELLSSKVK
jgi:hypothetical protein